MIIGDEHPLDLSQQFGIAGAGASHPRSPFGRRPAHCRFEDRAQTAETLRGERTSVADRLQRLCHGCAVSTPFIIDHSGKARDFGLDLLDTQLVIFGSPALATPVIEAAPFAALDLPFRVVVWQDGIQPLVSYAAPAAVARRYRLHGNLAEVLAGIDAIASAVIDR